MPKKISIPRDKKATPDTPLRDAESHTKYAYPASSPIDDEKSHTQYAYPSSPIDDEKSHTQYAYPSSPIDDEKSHTQYAYPSSPIDDEKSHTQYAYPSSPIDDVESHTKYAYHAAPADAHALLRMAEAEQFRAARIRRENEAAVAEILRFVTDLVEKEHKGASADSKAMLVGSIVSAVGHAILPVQLDLVRAAGKLQEARSAVTSAQKRDAVGG
jgi:hypothetical protein